MHTWRESGSKKKGEKADYTRQFKQKKTSGCSQQR